jgi:hypothetical protein
MTPQQLAQTLSTTWVEGQESLHRRIEEHNQAPVVFVPQHDRAHISIPEAFTRCSLHNSTHMERIK